VAVLRTIEPLHLGHAGEVEMMTSAETFFVGTGIDERTLEARAV